ncbi:collagen binding domain-containing protein [Paenibacillus selenitireducens]|uniref:collagen binding domain-containing protein n=1 Tax=Paenibacillus selenitireducens TaxID=1324314 RepID=UPI00117C4A99|nr:collagen binding domain-containing protein [Paenibacillus selenitireducens]
MKTKEMKKVMSLFFVIALLLNLITPMTFAAESSNEGIGADTSGKSVTEAVYDIPENIITNVRMTVGEEGHEQDISEIRPDTGERVRIYFDWQLPANHGYKANSSFTFDLPDKFTLSQQLTGDLSGGVGSYTVSPEGKVTLLFNENIENDQELDGYFFVWRKFDSSKLDEGTEQKILFPFKDEVRDVTVHFKNNGTKMDKSGIADKGFNPSKIDWIVDINKDENLIQKPRFEDIIPEGLVLDQSSIKVEELQVHLNGTVSVTNNVYHNYTHEITTVGSTKQQKLSLKFDNSIDRAYRVSYSTQITKTDNATYTNHAALYDGYDDQGQKLISESSGKVSVQFSQPLTKKAGKYDPVAQTVEWEIEYNYNEQLIKKDDAWLVDTYDQPAQELEANSFEVYKVSIDQNGQAVKDSKPLQKNVDYTLDEQKANFTFKLSFKYDIHEGYLIRYKTKLNDRVTTNGTADNSVVMHDGTESHASQVTSEYILSKFGKITSYKNKEIQWTIHLNDDLKTMNHVVLKDTFANQGLEFDENSLKIDGLEPDQKYTVTSDQDYTQGFLITFEKPVKKKYTITYTTTFDPVFFDTNKLGKYKNNVHLTWDDESNISHIIDKPAEVIPNSNTQNNGEKTGVYNAKDKTIAWTIDVNYNRHHIENAVLTDKLTGPQTFVEDSLVINKTSIDDQGNIVVGEQVDQKQYVVELTKSKENTIEGFKISFHHPLDDSYRITYKTSLKSLPVEAEYSNHATLYGDGESGTKIFEQSKTVKPSYGGEYIDKQGHQGTDPNDMDNAHWSIYINRSQSYIAENAVLEDTMSTNQIPMKDTFTLYSLKVDENGNLSKKGEADPNDYTLAFHDGAAEGTPTFTITFHKAFENAYLLEYQTYLNAVHQEKVTNSVSFAGKTAGELGGSSNQEFEANFSGAGGGAINAVKGNISIVKDDFSDPNIKLAGAVFELYNAAGDKLLATSKPTGKDGKVTFEGFKSGEYKIKEIIAPTGYVADKQLISIKFDAKNTTQTFVIKNKKIKQAFILTKVAKEDPTLTLEGAIFKLEKKEADGYHTVHGMEAVTSDAKGQVILANLDAGDYQLTEIKAPKGYKLDSTPIPFTIDQNQTIIKEHTMVNSVVDNGSIELTKVDGYDDKPLQGVEFELQDAYGHPVKSNLFTDQDGKITVNDLPAGRYQFVEITPLADYYPLANPEAFEITSEDQVKVSIENNKIPGSVKLTKVAAGNSDLKLKDAEFKLLDADKKPMLDKDGKELSLFVTDGNGELKVSNLRPGTYYLEETKAPIGYYMKDRYTEIHIVTGQETEVVVANYRYTSGGGNGGTVDPTPPVTPDPTKPVDPAKPVDPTKPVDPSEPGNPDHPSGGNEGKPGDGSNTGSTDNGGTNKQPPATKEEEHGHQVPGNKGNGQTNGQVLPKTGEDSHLPMQLAGLSIMLLGIALLAFRKKLVKS